MLISGTVAIHITLWGANRMVSDSYFKLIKHYNASYSQITRWYLSWVTDPITNYGLVGECKFPILVVTFFTSFHSWLVLTDFAIISWILDISIQVSMDLFEIDKVWLDLLTTRLNSSFAVWYISKIVSCVTFYVSQYVSSFMKTQVNCRRSSLYGQKESIRKLVKFVWSGSNTSLT